MPKAVIMAGGQGERFWPLTHAAFPKYRIRFDAERSLLQGTWERLRRLFKPSDIYVVTTRDHARFIRLELPALQRDHLLVEPLRNNTASAIVFSTSYLEKRFGGAETVCFFPADHLIQRTDRFVDTIRRAWSAARDHRLVTIGIEPRFPATGYGYIRRGRPLKGVKRVYEVDRFVEKPTRAKAQRYLRQGGFLWNAGMFVWRADAFREQLTRFAPEYAESFSLSDLAASYRRMPARSIDVALLEKSDRIVVASTDMDWCDMGSWEMFDERSAKNAERNAHTGPVVSKHSAGTFVLNHEKTPVVLMGLRDVIVVRTRFGILISKKTLSEEAARLAPRS